MRTELLFWGELPFNINHYACTQYSELFLFIVSTAMTKLQMTLWEKSIFT